MVVKGFPLLHPVRVVSQFSQDWLVKWISTNFWRVMSLILWKILWGVESQLLRCQGSLKLILSHKNFVFVRFLGNWHIKAENLATDMCKLVCTLLQTGPKRLTTPQLWSKWKVQPQAATNIPITVRFVISRQTHITLPSVWYLKQFQLVLEIH
jgi:hypothetical protein